MRPKKNTSPSPPKPAPLPLLPVPDLHLGTTPPTWGRGKKVGKMAASLNYLLIVLSGLLVGFFSLTRILEILRRLDWWWTSLIFPEGRMACPFQNTGHQTSAHCPGYCPWKCSGFLWMCLRFFIIVLCILLVLLGLLFPTENGSIILGKLQ